VLQAAGLLGIAVLAIGTSRQGNDEQPSPEWRKKFSDAALQIAFDKDRPPVDDTAAFPMATLPRALAGLRIAAARKRDTSRAGQIDFKITSDSEYPRLGLGKGANYVWRDFVDGHSRLVVIPANPKYKVRWLVTGWHNHLPPVPAPRVVIVEDTSTKAMEGKRKAMAEVCTGPCDDDKPMVWCTAHDTSRLYFKLPEVAIAQYFVRSKVAW